jgi:hypothetical protein
LRNGSHVCEGIAGWCGVVEEDGEIRWGWRVKSDHL